MLKDIQGGVIRRMALLVGLMLASLLVATFFTFLALSDVSKTYADAAHQETLALRRIELATDAQRNFLIQVQEWKNLLIRGASQPLFERHLSAFESQADKVQSELALVTPLLALPANREKVRVLRAAHVELLEAYRAALLKFDAKDPNSLQVVDGLVRGMDRQITEQFIDLLAAVRAYALQRSERSTARADDTAATARPRIVISFAGIALVALLGSVFVTRSMAAAMRQKNASERLLQESEVRYRQLVDLAPCAVLLESSGRWVFANPKAAAVFRAQSVSDLVDRVALESLHPDSREQVSGLIGKLYQEDGAGEPSEAKFLRLDGTSFTGEVSAKRYLHEGKPGVLVLLQDISVRKAAEHERDQFFSLSLDLLAIAGPDGFFKRVNPAFARTLGWSDEEFLGRPFVDFVHPDDVSATLERIKNMGAGEPTLRFENRYGCKDGTWRWLSWTGCTGSDGMVYAAARDLTASKAAEAELRVSEEYNRSIVDSSQDCLKVLSLDGRLLEMTANGCRQMGVTDIEQVRDADWLGFWRGAQSGAATAALATARDGGTGRFQGSAKTLAGEDRWWDVIVSPIRNADGKPDKLLAVSRDITLQQRAEDAIRTVNAELEHRVQQRTADIEFQKAFLRKVIDLQRSLIYAKDGEGRYVLLNDAVAKAYRMPADAILGKTDAQLNVFPTQVQIFRRQDQMVLDTSRELVVDEEQVIDAAGRVRWEHTVKCPIPWADGKTSVLLGVSTDITQRKLAEAEVLALNASLERRVIERTAALESANLELERTTVEAEQASRAKSLFLATMSHEIRTPMNGVLGMADVLAHGILTTDQADAVETIQTSARSLLGIIDDVLDFSKIEAGRLELDRCPIYLTELVEEVCDTLMSVASAKDVELTLFIDPTAPEHVFADPTRLRQVLYNLIGNAIKFSSGRAQLRGRVSLRVAVVHAEPLRLAFAVADNGIGIAPEELTRLFHPFVQAQSTTTRRFGGTGLGLVISKRLVELMHGGIEVTSSPGAGATFTVNLPFDVASGVPARDRPDLAGIDCILVASPDLRVDDLRAYLEPGGSTVHLCADADRAAELAARLMADHSAQVVVIQAGEHGADAMPALRAPFATALKVRHLLIATGRRRHPRRAALDTVTLDAEGLRRSTLLHAVAAAAGRASVPGLRHTTINKLQRQPVPSIAEARAQGQLILIAEDDEVNQKVILRQLELLGYAAELASNGAEALRRWRAGGYALLLTDLHMPEMDGYALAQAIRGEEAELAAPKRQRIPVLALTANALRGEETRARAAGMDEYLTKPLPLNLLEAALKKWLPVNGDITMPAERAPQTRNAQGSMTVVAVDVSVLKGLVGDDPQTVQELLFDYRASAQRSGSELRRAHAANDVRQLGAIAHQLKSSSRSVGALTLGDLCAELENNCRLHAKQGIVQGMAQFNTELLAVDDQLGHLLAPN